MKPDDNELLRRGELPVDPFEEAKPMELDAESRERLRREAEDLERKARDLRKALGEAEKPVELPTLARAVERFLDRQTGTERVWFPWPGTPEMPQEDTVHIQPGEVLPEGHQGLAWTKFGGLVGPLWPDRLCVLVGSTGRGKSGFALQVSEAVARAGHPVLYLSAEMGTDELVARLVAQRARGDDRWGVAWRTVLLGGAPQEDLQRACAALTEDCPRLYLWAPMAEKRNAKGLAQMTRAVVEAEGGRPPLVVVDYLQRMAEGEDLRGAVRNVSKLLRDMSRHEGLGTEWPGAAVLALSSTARGNYEHFDSCSSLKEAWKGGYRTNTKGEKVRTDPVPLEGMGKESGELETDASLLLMMTTNKAEENEDGPNPRNGLVVVAKNRHGRTGAVDFMFYPACGRFDEKGCKPEPKDMGEAW